MVKDPSILQIKNQKSKIKNQKKIKKKNQKIKKKTKTKTKKNKKKKQKKTKQTKKRTKKQKKTSKKILQDLGLSVTNQIKPRIFRALIKRLLFGGLFWGCWCLGEKEVSILF